MSAWSSLNLSSVRSALTPPLCIGRSITTSHDHLPSTSLALCLSWLLLSNAVWHRCLEIVSGLLMWKHRCCEFSGFKCPLRRWWIYWSKVWQSLIERKCHGWLKAGIFPPGSCSTCLTWRQRETFGCFFVFIINYTTSGNAVQSLVASADTLCWL